MRAPTAYFLFAGEVRPEIQADIAAQNDGKVSVAAIGKAIGLRWKQLSEEDRQKYKDKAKELKEQKQQREAEEAEEAGHINLDEHNDNTKTAPPPLPPFGLPTSLVKKIACMDPDVSRMSGDATKAIALASTLFIQQLAASSLRHATEHKRKNFKFSDIDSVSRQDHRYVDMGLHDFLKNDKVFQEMHTRIDCTENHRPTSRQKKGSAEDAKQTSRPLTDFFRQQQ